MFAGLPGRITDLLAPWIAREISLIALVTFAGTWIGRKVFTRLSGQVIFPNIFSVMIGSPLGFRPAVKLVEPLFADLGNPVLRANSGVRDGLSLTFLLRDPLKRHERVYTARNADPEFRRTRVDEGESERRLLIIQPSLASLVSGRNKSAVSLHGSLLQAFLGEPISCFMSHRDGGFLQSTESHIAVLTTCRRNEVIGLSSVPLADALFFIQESPSPLVANAQPGPESEYRSVQCALEWALLSAEGEVRTDDAALEVIQGSLLDVPISGHILVASRIVKVALVYAVLDESRTIMPEHARAAVAMFKCFEHALSTCQTAARLDRVEDCAGQIEKALRARPDGLSGTEISAIFGRNLKGSLLNAAKQKLLDEGCAHCLLTHTGGRRGERWLIGGSE